MKKNMSCGYEIPKIEEKPRLKFEDVELFGWKLLDSFIRVLINLAIVMPIYIGLNKIFKFPMQWGIAVFFVISVVFAQLIAVFIKVNMGYKIREKLFYKEVKK